MSMLEDLIPWSVAYQDQFIRYRGNPVAMCDTPNRAKTIVRMLNAQEAGTTTAAQHHEQPISDVPDQFVEQLAADLCDRAMRPARAVYHPSSWEQAGRENAGPPESTKRQWWRRHAREVISAVRHQVPPMLTHWLRAGHGGRTRSEDVALPAEVLDPGHGPSEVAQ